MLTKIVDVSDVRIDGSNRDAMQIDLTKRLPRYKHPSKPSGAESVLVKVRNGVYFDSFNFEMRYGAGKNEKDFVQIGDSIWLDSDNLPYNK